MPVNQAGKSSRTSHDLSPPVIHVQFTTALSTQNNFNAALAEAAGAALADLRSQIQYPRGGRTHDPGGAPDSSTDAGGLHPRGAGVVDLAFLFVSGFPAGELETAAQAVRQLTGARHVLGCTSGGVLGGGREVEHRPSVSLTLATLPNVEIHPFHVLLSDYPDGDAPPSEWHALFGVRPDENPNFILLPDPFTSDAQKLIDGLNYAFPGAVKIGGLASAGNEEGMNRLFLDDSVFSEGTVGVNLRGALEIETVVAQGCKPVGRSGTITKAQRFFLMEVDGRPAIEFIQSQVDTFTSEERDLARVALFLGIAMDPFLDRAPAQGEYLIRNIMGVDRERGYVAIGAHLTAGRVVQLHVRDRQTSIEDLLAVLRRANPRGDRPAGALLFSCLGRGRHLYGEPDKDTRLFHSVLGAVPLGGFFCNGEIGPVGGETYIHGFTSSFGLFKTRETVRP